MQRFRTGFYVFRSSPRRPQDAAIHHSGRKKMIEKLGVTPEERHRMIAETAYFLAHERGAAGGDPVADWIEAERKVDRQLCALATARMLERLESGVATATKKLAGLKRRASTLAAGARTELHADVEKLGALKQALRGKIDELSERGEEASEKALSQAEKVWNELGDVLQRIGARMQH
jgi:hypothetical protein